MTQEKKRLAVVVGNSEYQNFEKLSNASSDADTLHMILQSLDFEVTRGDDLPRNEILKCFDDIPDLKPREIVFHYSGRAVSSDGKIYLVPYDASTDFPEIPTINFLDVDVIIDTLLEKRNDNAIPIIIILNCHRPLLRSGSNHSYYDGHPLKNVSNRIAESPNVAILYSMTEDEEEKEPSLFTQIFLENMDNDWSQIYSNVSKFFEDSNTLRDKQVLWMHQNLSKPFRFCLPDLLYNYTDDSFNDVPPKNQYSVDRPEIFAIMDAILAERSDESRILALQGLKGTGKTQIMLRYCHLHHLKYDFIFWLEIDSKAAAFESFRKLAINLGLDVETAKEKSADNSIIEWVSARLENTTNWLLLLNDADENISNDILNALPQSGGDIIITTREPIHSTKTNIETVQISNMEEDEALSLLYGGITMHSVDQQDAEHQYAKEIVSELHFLPLAIDIARMHVNMTQMSFKDYLTTFRDENDRADVCSNSEENSNHSLVTVLKIFLELIKIENPSAVLILETCGFLKQELIPVSFFERQHSALEYSSDLSSSSSLKENDESYRIVQAAIAILEKFAFVTQTLIEDKSKAEDSVCGALKVPRLVQDVICDTMNNEQKIRCVRNLACALKNDTEFSDSDFYPSLAWTKIEEVLESKHPETADSLSNLALFYFNRGDFVKAESLFERALVMVEQTSGPEHPETAKSLNNLALLYFKWGDYNKAELLYERALMLYDKVLPEHPETAEALNNLAKLYNEQGSYSKAKTLHERALKISERALGADHLFTATCLSNLAECYSHQGNYTKAEPLCKDALAIIEKALGSEHPTTAISLSSLAFLYSDQGDYAKAGPLFEQAQEAFLTKFGPEHQEMAKFLNKLGSFHLDQRNYDEAMPLFERALVIREKALGPEHPEMVTYLNNLAEVYGNKDNYPQAESLYERALVIRERVLGPEHPFTARSLDNLAGIYKSQENYDKAEPLYERALMIRDKVLGPEHPSTAKSLSNLASIYSSQGNYAKAEPLYERARELYTTVVGLEHPETARFLDKLASFYSDQGNCAEAEPLYEQAQTIRENALGPGHPETVFSLMKLAKFHKKQGNHTKANIFQEQFNERMLALCEKFLGAEQIQILRMVMAFGGSLLMKEGLTA